MSVPKLPQTAPFPVLALEPYNTTGKIKVLFIQIFVSAEIYTLLPNIIRIINLRRMRLAWHVAHIGKMKHVYKIWSENLNVGDYLEDLRLDGRIILNRISKK
jgi:hypothetical protein